MHQENKVEKEDAAIIAKRTKIGLWLLAVYGSVYAAFIGLCAFGSKAMASWSPWEIPFSIWYGMGLMVGAMLMALLYGRLCRAKKE